MATPICLDSGSCLVPSRRRMSGLKAPHQISAQLLFPPQSAGSLWPIVPGLVLEPYGKWGPRSAPRRGLVVVPTCLYQPASWVGANTDPLFTTWALRRQRKARPECQRFDEGPGASSNLLPWFWEPKKVLSVPMGTPGLLHIPGQQMPTMPVPPSPVSFLPPPQASHTQLRQCPAQVLESRGPYLSCPPHPRTLAPLAGRHGRPLGLAGSQDGQEGPIPAALPACSSPTNVRGSVAGAWGQGLLKDAGQTHWALARLAQESLARPSGAEWRLGGTRACHGQSVLESE